MKKAFIIMVLVIMPALSWAQFNDHDGQLMVYWQAPSSGNPLDHYIWSYAVNGMADSITGESAAQDTIESSVVLGSIGDWAVFQIRAISVMDDTSLTVYSDTAFYNPEQGIDPPGGVTWIQGP